MVSGSREAGKDASDDSAVLPWRIVGGAFIHFVVPAYIIAVPVACLFAAPASASLAQVTSLALPFSGWFLGGYALVATLATLAAAGADPLLRARRRRRQARDPRVAADRSARRLAQAAGDGRRLLGDRAAALLDTIRDASWDHADPRFQALSTDLGEVVRTATAALSTAPAERRAAIADGATRSLDHLATALQNLVAERGRLDEGDALAVARYIQMRHAPSDFASDGH